MNAVDVRLAATTENLHPLGVPTTFDRWAGIHLRLLRRLLEPLGWDVTVDFPAAMRGAVAEFRFRFVTPQMTREYEDPDVERYLVRHMRRTWHEVLPTSIEEWAVGREDMRARAFRDAMRILEHYARNAEKLPFPIPVPS